MKLEDLQKINQLSAELRGLQGAASRLDNGARIVSFTLSQPPPSLGYPVGSGYMTYPPQMTAMIKTMVEDRIGQVEDELKSLGMNV